MDAGLAAPACQCREEVLGDPDKPFKREIRLWGEIFLVTMTAAEVAEIGDVPLDIKRFHGKMVTEARGAGKEEKRKFAAAN
jgi:hypothetical protein